MSHSGEGSVWYQREIAISAKKRGCHLITDDVLHQVPEIQKIKIGVANIHSKLRCITDKTTLSVGSKLLRHRQKNIPCFIRPNTKLFSVTYQTFRCLCSCCQLFSFLEQYVSCTICIVYSMILLECSIVKMDTV